MSGDMVIPFISQLNDVDQKTWLKALNDAMPNETIVLIDKMSHAEKQTCQLAIVANPNVDDLAQFPQLIWLHSVWAGVEKLITALKTSPVEVARLIDPMLSQTMAEAALAWTLYLHREMPQYALQQRNKQWQAHAYVPASQRTVGILGLGELGQASAKQLHRCGFNVIGWSRQQKKLENIECYFEKEGLNQLAAKADILLCLLPLTPKTNALIGHDFLQRMRKGSSLINFARGGIIDNRALLQAINRDHIKHAVLDVFEQEPLPADSLLWHHQGITVLPHISAPTNIASACAIVAKNITDFLDSGKIPRCVDKNLGY